MHWEAMRHWRSRGIRWQGQGHGGDFMARCSGDPTETADFHNPTWAVLRVGGSMMRRLLRMTETARGMVRRSSQGDSFRAPGGTGS